MPVFRLVPELCVALRPNKHCIDIFNEEYCVFVTYLSHFKSDNILVGEHDA